jgi:hypothetical protein
MWKYVLILAIGLAVGYKFGFADAQVHKQDIVARMIDRVGGSNRSAVGNDIDKQMDQVEKH